MYRSLIAAAILASMAVAVPETAAEAPDRLKHVWELRQEGRYEKALEEATALLESVENDPDATCSEVWDVRTTALVLNHIMEFSEDLRAELAETDSIYIAAEAAFADSLIVPDIASLSPIVERSLLRRRALVGDRDPLTAETLLLFAMVRMAEGDAEAAVSDARQAFGVFVEWLGRDHPLVLTAGLATGAVLMEAGREDEAEPLFRRALTWARNEGCDDPDLAQALGVLAYSQLLKGNTVPAEHMAREAVAVYRSFGREDSQFAGLLTILYEALLGQGEHEEAERVLAEAQIVYSSPDADDSPAQILILRATARFAAGDFDRADQLVREALSTERASEKPDPLTLASCHMSLGSLRLREGNGEAANRELQEALVAARTYQLEENLFVPGALSLLSAAALERDDAAEAEQYAREALAEGRRVLGSSHAYARHPQALLGQALYAQGRFVEAEEVLAPAVEEYPASFRRGFAESGFLRLTPFSALAATQLELGRTEDAWVAIEKVRARSLADLLLESGVRSLSETESARRDSMEQALDGLESRITAYRERSAGETSDPAWRLAEKLRVDLEKVRRLRAEFRRRMAVKYPFAEGQTFSLDRVQQAIPEDAALIGWLDFEFRKGLFKSWAYAIRRSGSVKWVGLGSVSEDTGAFATSLELRRLVSDPSAPELALREPARRLWSERLEPLLRALDGIDELIVIPSGPMLGIPIEVLVDDSGRTVDHRYAISYAPSATVFSWLTEGSRVGLPSARDASGEDEASHVREPRTAREPPARREAPQARRALLLGDPVFVERGQMTAGDAQRNADLQAAWAGSVSDDGFVRAVLAGQPDPLSSLPRVGWTREEVGEVAGLLPASTVLLGVEASEQALASLSRSGQLADYAIVHLATHALVDDRLPARSALVLSQVDLPDPVDAAIAGERVYDGLLTAKEILREWKLSAELVVLSACDTGLGRRVEGEGYIGLSNAFLQVGARSLLVSLWEVEDRATSLLMRRFYENWLGKEAGRPADSRGLAISKARALRKAKQWLASYADEDGRRPYQHPYYWSAFVLMGDRR